MLCPYCDHENIDGTDLCERCQMPLSDLYLVKPASPIELGLITDRVRKLGPKPAISVAADTPVQQVLHLLVDKAIGCVVVADEGRAVGIFSERDALLKINTDVDQLGDRPVSEFMTPEPETLDAAAKIAFAVQRMDFGSYRHLPIVSEAGELTGIISVRDILRYLTERLTRA